MTLYPDMHESINLILSFNFDLYGEFLFYFSFCIILYKNEMKRSIAYDMNKYMRHNLEREEI